MICKWTLDIFGNLIAHWLLASQSASPLMPGLAWGVALFERESLDWRVNDSVHVTPSQGNPRWNKPLKRRRRFPFIYPHKTLSNTYISWVILIILICIAFHTRIAVISSHFKMYLHDIDTFSCFRTIFLPQILKQILTLGMQKLDHYGETWSVPWLLMPWLIVASGHQQPWYWVCRINRSLLTTAKDFCAISVCWNDRKY